MWVEAVKDFDDYITRVRAVADARKPITREEWSDVSVYVSLVLMAAIVAAFIR